MPRRFTGLDGKPISASPNENSTRNGSLVSWSYGNHVRLLAFSVLACIGSSCKPQPADVQFVGQKIPIQIQRGKPVSVDIRSLSGNGVNDVGIRCSPEIWNVLTNGTNTMAVKLRSSNKPNTEIGGIDLHSGGTAFLGQLPNVHYLFYISGEHHAEVMVEIIFPNSPPEPIRAEIVVCKTPADTGL